MLLDCSAIQENTCTNVRTYTYMYIGVNQNQLCGDIPFKVIVGGSDKFVCHVSAGMLVNSTIMAAIHCQ